MIKAEFAAKIAEKTELSKAKALEVTEAMLTTILDSLRAGEEVRFLGFGTFSVAKIAARKSRNPRTGESIDLPERKRVKFKVSKKVEI